MRTGLTELVHKFRAISVARRRLLLVFCSLLGLLLFALNQRMEVPSVSKIQPAENFPTALQTDTGYLPDDDKQQNLPAILNELAESRAVSGGTGAAVPDSRTPLIAHTAELAVATKEFARSRLSLEEIVERHRGYASRLRLAGRRTGSVLSRDAANPFAGTSLYHKRAEIPRRSGTGRASCRRDHAATRGPGSALKQRAGNVAAVAGVAEEADLSRWQREGTPAANRGCEWRRESVGSRAASLGTSRGFR